MFDVNYILHGEKRQAQQQRKSKLDKLADERMMMGAREEYEKDKIEQKYKDKKTIKSKKAKIENKYKKKELENLKKAKKLENKINYA